MWKVDSLCVGTVLGFTNYQINYWGGPGRWTKEKKNGPVWFTLNPSVKIHRETQKNEFFNKY